MNSLRSYDIKYLKGVGPRRAELLRKELGIASGYDLVRHFPTHYLDRSKIYTVRELSDDMPYVQLRGRFVTDDGDFSEFEWELKESHIYIDE